MGLWCGCGCGEELELVDEDVVLHSLLLIYLLYPPLWPTISTTSPLWKEALSSGDHRCCV